MRRRCAVAVIVLLLAAGCGQGPEEARETPKEEEATPTETGAAVLPIQVDGLSDARDADFVAFFPKDVSARPGDTLRFKQVYTGEPHNVILGSIVNAAVPAVERAGPNAPPPPEAQKVLDIFGPPPNFQPINQAAAQACFLDSGDPPRVDPCQKRPQPDFNGRQSWYNSGYIEAENTFDVKLADDIDPGTYNFVCSVHWLLGMRGKLTVVDENASRPGAAAVERRGRQELQQAVQAFKPALDQAASATPDKAVAGALSQNVMTGNGLVFGPREISIPTGGEVSWNVFAFHTISINPPPDAFNVLVKAADGTVRPNTKLDDPSKAPRAPVLFPPGPNVRPTTFDAGSYDGTGFFNSGLLVSVPPALLTYKLRFTNPGTYELRCLIHPDMRGQVKVGS
jgi:plastocyanin